MPRRVESRVPELRIEVSRFCTAALRRRGSPEGAFEHFYARRVTRVTPGNATPILDRYTRNRTEIQEMPRSKVKLCRLLYSLLPATSVVGTPSFHVSSRTLLRMTLDDVPILAEKGRVELPRLFTLVGFQDRCRRPSACLSKIILFGNSTRIPP